MDKPSPNYTKISEFLDKLNPDLLGDDSFEFKDDKGKTRHTASNKEKWYSLKTKCLEEMEDFHNCAHYCELALSKVKEFHFDNDIWFKRRLAISKFELNQKDEALKIIDEIMARKKEWFIYSDKGFMLIKMNQKEKGIQYLIQAINTIGPDQMKIKIFQYFADNFKDGKYSEFSKLVKLYVIRIREKNSWPISDESKKFLETLDNETLKIPMYAFKNKLMFFIEKEFVSSEISTSGKVDHISDDGRTGIIKPDIGPTLFFRSKNVVNNTKGFPEGTKVSFQVIDSFDKVKNIASKEAVDIRIIT
jgi:tetratricopeptide (TPR) repeat protein